MKKIITRNEFYKKVQELGVFRAENEYDIAPLDLSEYKLSEATVSIANANFTKETEDPYSNYMLWGHWALVDICYQFVEKCKFELTIIDPNIAVAFSDEQLAIFTYCVGDITLTPFADEKNYKAKKADTKKFWNI